MKKYISSIFLIILFIPIFTHASGNISKKLPSNFILKTEKNNIINTTYNIFGETAKYENKSTESIFENNKGDVVIFNIASEDYYNKESAELFIQALKQMFDFSEKTLNINSNPQQEYLDCIKSTPDTVGLRPDQALSIRKNNTDICLGLVSANASEYAQYQKKIDLLNDKIILLSTALDISVIREDIYKNTKASTKINLTSNTKNFWFTEKDGGRKVFARRFYGPNGSITVKSSSKEKINSYAEKINFTIVNSNATKVYQSETEKITSSVKELRSLQGYTQADYKNILNESRDQLELNTLTDSINSLKFEIANYKLKSQPKLNNSAYCTQINDLYSCFDVKGNSFSIMKTIKGTIWTY